MAAEWTSATLGDVADFLSGGTPSKDNPAYWGGTTPWVSAKDMKRLQLEDTEDHLTDDGILKGTKLVPAGTVFLLTRGMTLLHDVPISIAGRPMTFNQDVKALLPKAGVSGDFLPYLLLGQKHRLKSLVDLAGHGTGRLNLDELKALKVLLPPEEEQRAIAQVVSTIDAKTELNRRMNETLEAMARALFKSWFVDFDPVRIKAKAKGHASGLPNGLADLFPASLRESDLGEIPREWGICRVDDLASLSREGLSPGNFPEETFAHFSIPAFDAGRTPRIEKGEAIKSQKFIVKQDSVLFSKLNPRIPRVWLPEVANSARAVCSTEFLVVLPRTGIPREFLYCLFSSKTFSGVFGAMVTGTSGSHQRVQPESLFAMETVLPGSPVIRRFAHEVRPLLMRANRALDESNTIASLRDAILPKLISGELRIRDAERIVGRHA